MHRTYSMRQSRVPTASQIENPPPPMSSTKSNRWLGKGGIGEWHTRRMMILISSLVVDYRLLLRGGVPRSPMLPYMAYTPGGSEIPKEYLRSTQRAMGRLLVLKWSLTSHDYRSCIP